MATRSQRGMTLVELLAVLAVAAVLLVVSASYSMQWLAIETLRSGMQDVQAYVQLARTEAVARNQQCRFVVDTSTGVLQVWDGVGTLFTNDDVLVHEQRLPSGIVFARPDAGSLSTLQQIGTTAKYQTVFRSDGSVVSGTGDVFLYGGERFGSISVHAAGGTEMFYWNGSDWDHGG